MIEWFESRGIDSEIVAEAEIQQKDDWIIFPYFDDFGHVVSTRSGEMVGKYLKDMEREGPQAFYNNQAISLAAKENKPLVICQREIDVLSFKQAGYAWVIGCTDANLIYENLDKFKPINKIILAAEDNPTGRIFNGTVSRIVGEWKCLFVEYQNANDALLKGKLTEVLDNAKNYPVVGLYKPDEFPPMPDEYKITYQTGFGREHDHHIKLMLGKLMVVTGIPGHGKALDIRTKIPTPNGWTTMGDLEVGDLVFDERGYPTTVINCTEIMYGRPCYRLTFSDGVEIICDEDHRWVTRDDRARRSLMMAKKNNRLRPRDLHKRGTDQTHKRKFPTAKSVLDIANTLFVEGGKRKNHAVAVAGQLKLPHMDYCLPPYVLGCWLGDGTSLNGGFSTADSQILEEINKEGFTITEWSGKYSFGIDDLKPFLRHLNLIGNKHIPEEYLRGSVEQRLALLQGLMDTDGSITDYGRSEFCSTNKSLAYGVYDLASGLGIKARILEERAKLYGKDCGERFRVTFTSDLPTFRLERKLKNVKGEVRDTQNWRYIINCEKVDSVPVKCIEVASNSHQYLCTEAYLPTHNSEWSDSLCLNLAKKYGWKLCVCSTEIDNVEYQENTIRRYLRRPLEQVGAHEPQKALDFYQKHYTFITNATMDDDLELTLEKLIELAEIAIIRDGCKVIMLDPWNEIEHARESRETETDYTNRAIRKLKRLAKVHKVLVIIVAHPKMPEQGKLKCPTMYSISGSAHWFNKADYGIILWRENPSGDQSEVRIAKIKRHGAMGKPGKIQVRLNAGTANFEEVT